MFPFCFHPKLGSRLTDLRRVAIGARPNISPEGRHNPMTETLRWNRAISAAPRSDGHGCSPGRRGGAHARRDWAHLKEGSVPPDRVTGGARHAVDALSQAVEAQLVRLPTTGTHSVSFWKIGASFTRERRSRCCAQLSRTRPPGCCGPDRIGQVPQPVLADVGGLTIRARW
jgi:hypothetical protein